MKLSQSEVLARLGSGESIEQVCAAAEWDRSRFDQWWQTQLRERLPQAAGRLAGQVAENVEIVRDSRGIPHIYARRDADLFYGFGLAMAQDRLFQLDYLRRKGQGRLAEVLGPEGLESDVIARTIGLPHIAAREWRRLPDQVCQTLEAFAAGVNRGIEALLDTLPIECALLDYIPEPWTPVDCLAIESEFRWYLTGRFPVIVIPELAKRKLSDPALYQQFLLGEADEESILWPGEYPVAAERPTPLAVDPVGHTMSDPDEAVGSNNWVLSGSRTASGAPLVASDPHIAIEAVSCWYQAHLCGENYHAAGMAYVGIPAIMFGRTPQVAWGITNNICSLRDLYLEQVDDRHPGCFRFDDRWEPARERQELIEVRGREPVNHRVRSSRNGPVVNQILPEPARAGAPVTLKWLGAHEGGWLTSLLAMGRSTCVESFCRAVEPWHVPTFSLVVADRAGRIGFQAAGRIPVRARGERGYRRGWDPEDQWQGVMPFAEMPRLLDPSRGWIATANNRLAPDDHAYPLAGCWSSGWRAKRIRELIEDCPQASVADMGRMQQDARSLRAQDLVPPLLDCLAGTEGRVPDGPPPRQAALEALRRWDYHVHCDSVAATVFNVFFSLWCRRVAEQRFDPAEVELIAAGAAGLAGRLLKEDPANWFAPDAPVGRIAAIRETFDAALTLLQSRFGHDAAAWTWDRLHLTELRHVLASRGDLASLLNQPDRGVRGDMVTVCNSGSGPDWRATTGAGYRLIADLASDPPALLAVDAASQSGNPGSPHYRDQFEPWQAGRYQALAMHTQPELQQGERLTVCPEPDVAE